MVLGQKQLPFKKRKHLGQGLWLATNVLGGRFFSVKNLQISAQSSFLLLLARKIVSGFFLMVHFACDGQFLTFFAP